MNYRGFTIVEHFNYDVNPVRFDGVWFEDEETPHMIHYETLENVKQEIDDYIAERTVYFVCNPVSKTITKFFQLTEAIAFCDLWKIAKDNIRFTVAGFNQEFDSI